MFQELSEFKLNHAAFIRHLSVLRNLRPQRFPLDYKAALSIDDLLGTGIQFTCLVVHWTTHRSGILRHKWFFWSVLNTRWTLLRCMWSFKNTRKHKWASRPVSLMEPFHPLASRVGQKLLKLSLDHMLAWAVLVYPYVPMPGLPSRVPKDQREGERSFCQ